VVYAHKGKNAIAIDMDITKCFDRISHDYILESIKRFNLNEEYAIWIERMLRSGYIENGKFYTTQEGTPQGGVISPALCNLVLRQILDIPLSEKKFVGIKQLNCTSYADDAVIILTPNLGCKTETIERSVSSCLEYVKNNLSIAGLELNETKTKVITDDTPFDFLGFQISRGKGIRPPKKKIKAHHREVMSLLRKGSRMTNVNAVIRGFYNYYAHFSSGKMWKSLGKLDWYNTRWLWKKGLNTESIVTFTDIPKTTKYISPKKGATPLLGEYSQFYNDRLWPSRKKYLAKKQKDVCPICNNRLGNNPSFLEAHHVLHKNKGGKDKNSNVILIHQSCHQMIHTLEEE
jgi:RNA-directed DNA polymerase